MLNAKEIAAMYNEYTSLKWLVDQYDIQSRTFGSTKSDIKPGILNCGGASGVWHRNSRQYIEDQCNQAFINSVNTSIEVLEQEFAVLGIDIEKTQEA